MQWVFLTPNVVAWLSRLHTYLQRIRIVLCCVASFPLLPTYRQHPRQKILLRRRKPCVRLRLIAAALTRAQTLYGIRQHRMARARVALRSPGSKRISWASRIVPLPAVMWRNTLLLPSALLATPSIATTFQSSARPLASHLRTARQHLTPIASTHQKTAPAAVLMRIVCLLHLPHTIVACPRAPRTCGTHRCLMMQARAGPK